MNRNRDVQRMFYRNQVSNSAVWMLTTFGALYFLTRVIKALEERETSAVLIGLAILFMVVFLVPALRVPFHGVVVTDTYVRVRNITRTFALGWNEIERFELSRYASWPMIGVVILKNGDRIPMTGVQFALATRFAQNTVAALNERLATVRARDETQSEPADEAPV